MSGLELPGEVLGHELARVAKPWLHVAIPVCFRVNERYGIAQMLSGALELLQGLFWCEFACHCLSRSLTFTYRYDFARPPCNLPWTS